ncbi:MAG: SAM hydrolase/SAM-dependent halogenase family protein, partial [Acidimicrobiales bacterium]
MSAPELRFNTISFLSDYGHRDEFVGVVHSVVRSIAPAVRVIDITHEIAPHDVRAGGLALARSAQYMAPGIALAVVDPGVGTERKPVVIEVADGAAFLVGPDNGLLAPAVAMVGGATGAVILDNPDYRLPPMGQTFDGRDVFAPAAAHLCLGVPMAELGTAVDPIQLLPGLLPVSEVQDDGSIKVEILWIDRFGNAQINLEPEFLDDWPDVVSISGGRIDRNATRVATFGEIPGGGFG